jgi:signal transduction histidine kinase/CheY-like chemotaxis protein
MVHPDDLPGLEQAVRETLATASPPGSLELRVHGKEGQVATVSVDLVPLCHGAEVVGVVGFGKDITALKEAERQSKVMDAQYRQAQKMEIVGHLAGGIAHDFNNLLTAILGYSNLLLGEFDANDPRREDLEEIRKAGERAAALTNQLLVFSRKQVVQLRHLDLNASVKTLEHLLRRLIGEDVKLATVQGQDLGLVNADPGQIDQVVMNLSVNARDAMLKGGTLTIETANVEFNGPAVAAPHSLKPGRYVMLAVTDTGCGMNADTQSHLFEPFFTTKEPGKGTGLGLATVYAIVKQSGGYILVESEPDRGSAFKIYLPRLDSQDVSIRPDEAAGPIRGGSETILLVEDEEALRALVSTVLQRHGYRVLEASTGSGALRTARQLAEPIQLLLTDVVMPGMGGPELANLILEMRPEIKVIYMSGYIPDAAFLREAREAGAPLLQKPFAPDSLAMIVRKTLDAPRDLPA